MALVLKDRVKETTTTTGTGTVTLAGASTGYQSFSAIGNANTTYYCIAGQGTDEWEVGIGTYTSSGTTLSRDTILASSNSGSAVNFSAGTKDVFVVYPAGKSVNLDASNNATALGTVASATLTNATGLPISTGVSGLGTGVATALAVNTGSSGAFVVNGGALGTPSSGTVTNLTGTASININGTVGATTPNTGAFTTLSSTGNTTLGDASGDTLTVNAGTWTTGKYTQNTSAGTLATGSQAINNYNITASGDAGGLTSVYAAHNITATYSGANAATTWNGAQIYSGHSGSSTITTQTGAVNAAQISSTGNSTNLYANNTAINLTNTGSATTAAFYATNSPSITSSGTIGTLYGLVVNNLGNANVTTAVGVRINDFTNSTNMRGIQSAISSGANKYNLYIDGTAENYFAGNVGIGAVAATTGQLRIAGNGSGATTFNGISLETSIQSGVTGGWRGLLIRPTTQATAFTLSNIYGVYVNPQTFGAGSTVTNQYGVHVESTLTGATNNYGFYSNIASGTGRWNFYANGTADNYFAGNVGIGTSSPSSKLEVYDATSAVARVTAGTEIFEIRNTGSEVRLAVVSADPMTFRTSNVEAMRIDASGNVGIGTSSPSTYGKFAVQTQTSNAPTVAITGSGLNPQLNHYINDSTAVLRNLNQIQFVTGSSDISNYQGYMTFSTMGSAGGTISERMRIDSSGNVGIGTSSPTAKLDVSSDVIRLRTAKTPASASATGNAGDIAWDSSYIYVCVATNTWKRVAIATW
jgi:hypothetical protein